MFSVYLENQNNKKLKVMEIDLPVSGKQLMEKLQNVLGDECENFFFKNNGRLIQTNDIVWTGDFLHLEQKLCGGKGGFGSMLRAIGAQIEKTTNREACRDLSGRRLRDINEEKRLKTWIDQQAKRNEEAAERKKKKLAKLCAVPKHEFKDKAYEEQRSTLTEKVEEAVEVGFAAASVSNAKRPADSLTKTNPKKKVKTLLGFDDDIDLDDLNSSSSSSSGDSENEETNDKIDDTNNCTLLESSDSNQSKSTNKSVG